MAEKLTALQETILEIEKLNLPLRESVRLANWRVGFFVGQLRYEQELARAQQALAAQRSAR